MPSPEPPNITVSSDRPLGVGPVAWLALVGLAGVMLGLLLWRGVLPGLSFSGDLTMIHAGARLWWEGGNPYDFEALYAAYEEAGGRGERQKDVKWFVALYPPTTYATLGPWGVLSWPAARAVWLLMSIASAAAIAAWAWRWRPQSKVSEYGSRAAQPLLIPLLLLAVWLGFAPLHTTLKFGQLGLVVLALLVWAVGSPGRKPKPWLAGLLLAIAGAIKPQLAGLIALGLLPLGRWRELVWCLGFGLVITVIAVGRFEVAGVPWLQDLLTNLDRFAGKDFADPRPSNDKAFQMINLDPLAWRLGFDTAVGRLAVWGVFGLSCVWAVWKVGKARCSCHGFDERDRPSGVTLWVMSLLAVLTLLVAYHRFYDAVLLAVPAVWLWRAWTDKQAAKRRTLSLWLAALAMLWFVLPITQTLDSLRIHGHLPASIFNLPGWHTVVMHGSTWTLLALWLALLIAGPSPNGVSRSACPLPGADTAPRSTAAPM